MGPSLLAPAGGWHAVHNGALQALTAMLYMMGPFGPPSRAVPADATSAGVAKKNSFGCQQKKSIFFIFQKKIAGAGTADPKNQNYIAIPFICHLWEHSLTTQS